MNTQHLEDNYPRLIYYMEESDYSRIYISRFKREINCILSMSVLKDWTSYMDIYLGYDKSSNSIVYRAKMLWYCRNDHEFIDWSEDLIRVKQQKTDVPLELPLTLIVGNAIFVYITTERPKTGLAEIFLSQGRP